MLQVSQRDLPTHPTNLTAFRQSVANIAMKLGRAAKLGKPGKLANLVQGSPQILAQLAHWRRVVSVVVLSGMCLSYAANTTAQEKPTRELVNVRGDLYRFINNHHASVVYVTEEGIIIGDPINRDAALWLKNKLDEQFGLPVRYMFYSHHHADHASGGEVFAETGTVVVAHENAATNIVKNGIPTALPTVVFKDQITLLLGGKKVTLHHFGANHSDDMIAAHFPAEEAVFAVDFVSVERLPYRNLQGAHFPGW